MASIGQTLRGRYYLIAELGKGGFGQTYKARDLNYYTPTFCVVKHLKPDNPTPAQLHIARQLFIKEADTLDRLGRHSTQIPTLMDRFEEAGEFYLVQEWIDEKHPQNLPRRFVERSC